MNDFDQLLELNLRHMLDPVVAAQPPTRRGRLHRARKPVLTADAIPVVEPVVVAIPAAAASQV